MDGLSQFPPIIPALLPSPGPYGCWGVAMR